MTITVNAIATAAASFIIKRVQHSNDDQITWGLTVMPLRGNWYGNQQNRQAFEESCRQASARRGVH